MDCHIKWERERGKREKEREGEWGGERKIVKRKRGKREKETRSEDEREKEIF